MNISPVIRPAILYEVSEACAYVVSILCLFDLFQFCVMLALCRGWWNSKRKPFEVVPALQSDESCEQHQVFVQRDLPEAWHRIQFHENCGPIQPYQCLIHYRQDELLSFNILIETCQVHTDAYFSLTILQFRGTMPQHHSVGSSTRAITTISSIRASSSLTLLQRGIATRLGAARA